MTQVVQELLILPMPS